MLHICSSHLGNPHNLMTALTTNKWHIFHLIRRKPTLRFSSYASHLLLVILGHIDHRTVVWTFWLLSHVAILETHIHHITLWALAYYHCWPHWPQRNDIFLCLISCKPTLRFLSHVSHLLKVILGHIDHRAVLWTFSSLSFVTILSTQIDHIT